MFVPNIGRGHRIYPNFEIDEYTARYLSQF